MGITIQLGDKVNRLLNADALIRKETVKSAKRAQSRIRRAVLDAFRGTRVGAALARKPGPTRLKAIARNPRPTERGGTVEAGVVLGGIAAIVATGGRTGAHIIGRPGKLLFSPKGFAATGPVRHLGSRFQRDAFQDRAAVKASGILRDEAQKGVDAVAKAINGR